MHTPGPWGVEKHAPFGWSIRAPRERHLGAGTLLCQLSGYEAGADAHLIAAAPELLAALRRIREQSSHVDMSGGEEWNAALDAADAAIAKAEGK